MTRPSTPDVIHADGRRTITVKRLCDGCGEPLGDATNEELEAAIMGRLPSVITEHGCTPEPPIEKIAPAATPQEGTPAP
jgi:hypothetical protein